MNILQKLQTKLEMCRLTPYLMSWISIVPSSRTIGIDTSPHPTPWTQVGNTKSPYPDGENCIPDAINISWNKNERYDNIWRNKIFWQW